MSNQQNLTPGSPIKVAGSPLKVNTSSPDKATLKEPESPATGGGGAGGS